MAIESLNYNQFDSEKIYVECSPKNSLEFVKIYNLISDIQKEFDKSWAILGEIYGFIPLNKPSIRFRRISSNLENSKYVNNLPFLTKKIGFHVDNNLSRLLVAPLYGDNPTFGVRELLQNSIDSCLERKEMEYSNDNFIFIPEINVSLERIDDEWSLFTIQDNGKGMNEFEIINYFLSVGTSFRKSMDWKKRFVDDDGKSKVNRNGKFGIGVLAAFLLGDEIEVHSKSILDNTTYSFTASIDSQSINVSKHTTLETHGVKISIKVDNDRRENLLAEYYRESNVVKWTNWYIYDEPRINFFLDREQLILKNEYDITKYFSFKTNSFELIRWNYNLIRYNNSYESYEKMLACNGIVINKAYSNDRFRYGNKNYYNLITSKPTVIVDDKDGIFPLKLDRSELDSSEFPFEEQLLGEVSKHYLAKILTIDIDLENIQNNNLLHNGEFLYGENGFIIDSEYFLEGVESLGYNYLKIITDKNTFNLNSLNLYKETLILISLKESINLTVQRNSIFPEGGARIILPKNKFDIHFSQSSRRLPQYIKRGIEIENQNDDYVIYKSLDFKKPFILSNIESLDKQLIQQIQSLQEISIKYFSEKTHKVTKDIFRKYIKDNYIIPYDINERKKLYSEAFRELKEFI